MLPRSMCAACSSRRCRSISSPLACGRWVSTLAMSRRRSATAIETSPAATSTPARARLLVRSLGELRSLSEIRDLPIDGGRRKLSDIADVRRGYPKQEEFNFLNGKEAVTARVYKTSTANLLEVADAVKAELAEIRNHPDAEGLELRVYRDSSEDVRNGLGQLESAGAIGGLLAIVFLYLFLRKFRTTLLIGLAIPISIVLTFVIMYLLRQAHLSTITINIMSLMGLMLALGMLVDNSVVVIESIFRHVQDLGEDARTAALHGTSAVAMPIVASTLTTICVFVPLIFLASSGRRLHALPHRRRRDDRDRDGLFATRRPDGGAYDGRFPAAWRDVAPLRAGRVDVPELRAAARLESEPPGQVLRRGRRDSVGRLHDAPRDRADLLAALARASSGPARRDAPQLLARRDARHVRGGRGAPRQPAGAARDRRRGVRVSARWPPAPRLARRQPDRHLPQARRGVAAFHPPRSRTRSAE